MIAALINAALPWLLGVLGGLGVLLAAWARGRRDARMEEDLRQAREASARRERMDDAVDRYRRDGGAADSLRRGDY